MKRLLELPHRVCESTCYINGLEDILEWKGVKYPYYLLSVLGGIGEFTYLKFKIADPPCMVYWGANPKYLLNDLENIIGFKQVLTENRVFKNTFPKIKEHIDNGQPVVAGALDMYYLHYYRDIYKKQHIPIHYILIVGYDDKKEEVYIHDCTFDGVQNLSYEEFEKSLNVNVPGMSKKNTIRAFILPDKLPSELETARKGFNLRAEKMLNPPISMLGIPAMKKLSKEIFNWENEKCFDHLVTYATTPPHLPETFENSNGMRFWKSRVLNELGTKYEMDNWVKASELFNQSGKLIIDICEAAMDRDRKAISDLILKVADIEERAYGFVKTK
jgi:hypothetical protein